MNPLMLMVAAGAALGYLDKAGTLQGLPKLPFLGEHGTIALAAYFLPGGPITAAIGRGALFLSAWEFMKQGSISGEPYWDAGYPNDPANRW